MIELLDRFPAPFGINALRLDKVSRWGIVSMSKIQSVAEHSFNVAIITEYLLNESGYITTSRHQAVPLSNVVVYALHHDSGECYTGDIPSICKTQKAPNDNYFTNIVKLADRIEAYRFAMMYCNDTEKVQDWLMPMLKQKVFDTMKLLKFDSNFEYTVIEQLMEDI